MHRVKTRQSRSRRLLGLTLGVSASLASHANPTAPTVAAGTVTFANPNPTTLEITNSPAAIINWQSFDIGVGETTRFIQQDAASAVLNRVHAGNASEILGSLTSNGRVFLVNPSGILIGRDGMVDTAGLVLSTLDITNEDFLAGRLRFDGGPDSGGITNHGYIKTAPGGEVVLLAPKILNAPEDGNPQSGLIESENGELVLAAGYSITITSLDDPDISFDVSAPAGEVVNLGRLIAQGGSVDVLAATIRHSGEINADALSVDETGRIVLAATAAIDTAAGSVISARGERRVGDALLAPGAAGGEVRLRASAAPAGAEASVAPTPVTLAGRVDVSGATGGTAAVEADTVTLRATVDASGAVAGGRVRVLGGEIRTEGATVLANATEGAAGEVRIGGGFQGGEGLRAADTTTVDAASRFEANARAAGDGGRVIVWSELETSFQGRAEARGGDTAGDGGLVEVSGKEILRFSGGVDVGAPAGDAGTLLLDPRTIFIVEGGATLSVGDPTPFAGDGFGTGFSNANVLSNGNVLIVNQNADVEVLTEAGKLTLVDAGELTLFDSFGNVLGSLAGNATNERLGAFGSFSNADGNRFFRSPDASANGLAQAGALILFDIGTGREIGRTTGVSALERFSSEAIHTVGGNLVAASSRADVGGFTDAGSVVTLNATTGTEVDRIFGSSDNEAFGNILRVGFTAPDTFVVQSPNADIGGRLDTGRVVMGSALTGQQLGQVVGGAAGDRFGATVDYFSTPPGTYLIRSAVADVDGLTDNGTAILVGNGSGNEIGRTSGLASNDNLGSFAPQIRASGNYFLQVPDADAGGATDAGSLVLVSGTSGTRIGQLDGTANNEFLGSFGTFDTFSLGSDKLLVTSVTHDNPGVVGANEGGIFVLADHDLGGGSILLGSTLGGSANEFLGNSGISLFTASGFVVTSPDADTAGGVDSGSVLMIDRLTGNLLDRVDGGSAGDRLGANGIITSVVDGNYWIPNPEAGVNDAGSVILASGSTGALIGRVDGDTAGERFGDDFFDGQLFNGDLLVLASGHGGGAGLLAQLAASDLGGGSILRNSVAGAVAGDFTGAGLEFLVNGNYVLLAPNTDVGGATDAGAVTLLFGGTGGVMGTRIEGNSNGENLGADFESDLFRFNLVGGPRDDFAILSPGHGGGAGAVFFVDSTVGGVFQVNGANGDLLGSFALELVKGQHIAIRNPLSDTGGSDAGAIVFVDPFAGYNTSGSVLGNTANELLGGADTTIDLLSLSGDLFLVHSPLRNGVGGELQAGGVIIMEGIFNSAVTLQGVVSGQQPNDRLGENTAVQELANGNYLLLNPFADDPAGGVGVENNEGASILVSRSLFSEIGRFYGQTDDNERLGDAGFVTEMPNGNFFLNSRFAGANNEGALYLGDGATGLLLGKIDGTTPNENFGGSIDPFTLGNGDTLVQSSFATIGGLANAGTIVQVASVDLGGGNLVRGRIDGGSPNERLGDFGYQLAPDGVHWFARSPNADPGGLVDAGSLYFVDGSTGVQSNRIDGLAAGDRLGGDSIFTGSAGNLFIFSADADVGGVSNAGRVIVAGAGGSVLGAASGNTANEFFGDFFQFIGNDIWVTAVQHGNGAGGVFALANQDLGGGNIVRASLLGSAPGDKLGASGFSFLANDRVLFRVPLADVGGVTDAGRILMTDRNLQVLGGTVGTSVNERFGTNSPISMVNNGLAIVSELADVGGLVDAGAIVQIDPLTGREVQRVTGISADERLGSFGRATLADGRVVFASPLADVNGVEDAGRLVFFDSTLRNQGAVATDLLFSNTPEGDFVVTTGAIANALNAGANLILQANSDIVIQKGAVLTGSGGSLTLQAGRSVIVNGLINMPGTAITILAAADQAGVDPALRGDGPSSFTLEDPQIVGRTVDITAEFVSLNGGLASDSTPLVWEPVSSSDFFTRYLLDGTAYPATFVLALERLSVDAGHLSLSGGPAPGAFAALVSFGEFSLTADSAVLTAGTADGAHALLLGLGGLAELSILDCVGCGSDPLLTDPFLSPAPITGFFVSGLIQNPAIDSVLAMLDRADDEEEDQRKKRCN
jgi:filamentous hemagglutinin family protein